MARGPSVDCGRIASVPRPTSAEACQTVFHPVHSRLRPADRRRRVRLPQLGSDCRAACSPRDLWLLPEPMVRPPDRSNRRGTSSGRSKGVGPTFLSRRTWTSEESPQEPARSRAFDAVRVFKAEVEPPGTSRHRVCPRARTRTHFVLRWSRETTPSRRYGAAGLSVRTKSSRARMTRSIGVVDLAAGVVIA